MKKNIKIAWNEWVQCKPALAWSAVFLVSKSVSIFINARILLLLGSIFDDLGKVNEKLITLVVMCVIQVALDAAITATFIGRHEMYTSASDRYTRRLLHADYDMYTKYSCSSIVTSTQRLWGISSVGKDVSAVLIETVNIVVTLCSIYSVFPKLILPVMATYACGVFLMHILFMVYGKIDTAVDKVKRSRNQEIEEVINGFAEVRSFCTEEHHRESIQKQNASILSMLRKRGYISMILNTGTMVVDGLGTIVTAFIVAPGVISGTLAPARAIMLVMFVWRLMEPLQGIMSLIDMISMNLAALDDFAKVLEYENTVENGTLDIDHFQDKLELVDVGFSYGDNLDEVLSGINMTIKKGQKIGICGISGGGKTTLFKLLAKFYDPTEGSIRIDGVDLRKLKASSLRRKLGIVHQDNHIFGGTIYENIVYGNWNSSEYEVIEACKKANIYDFIQGLPEKFNTLVGPKGLKLSGGQKQRIAIARVFLTNPESVLLDEATSALDNDSEAAIQKSMLSFADKTVITIAHRLSTIKDSDCIYVIGDHRIIESGTHEELLKKNGVYASMLK